MFSTVAVLFYMPTNNERVFSTPSLAFIVCRFTCTPIFIAALFTIAKIWKKPKYPSTGEWIKKM